VSLTIEDDLDAKKKAEDKEKADLEALQRRTTSRRSSLASGKRILESLGILSAKQAPIPEPASENAADEGPSASPFGQQVVASAPAPEQRTLERKNTTTKKRTFSFKIRGFGSRSDKQKEEEQSGQSVPRSSVGPNLVPGAAQFADDEPPKADHAEGAQLEQN
jgi:hypothetical protein